MSGRFSGNKPLGKTTCLTVLIFALFLSLFACAPSIIKTYDGPALSKDEICILAPVMRKADPAEKTKGQKVVSFLIAAPDRYYSLFVSEIDGVRTSDAPHPYYELAAGKHQITFKMQRETISYWGETKSEYEILNIEKMIEMDAKAGRIYFIDFNFDNDAFNLISKDVTEDPEYRNMMKQR